MKKIAFYLMNKKGFYSIKKFIKKFGSDNIEYIISSPDKNMQKDYFDKIKKLAYENKIKFFNKSDKTPIIEKKFDGYKFAIGWRWIISNSENLIVFHDSLLPKFRGFSPLVNSLVLGENTVGVTALFANDEYDKGRIIMQKSISVDYPVKINFLINQIKPIYFSLIRDIYKLIINDEKIIAKEQNETKATYSLWLDDKDYFIDWESWSADKIKRFVDATDYPYDNAKTYLNNKIIKFIDVEVIDDAKIEDRQRHIGKIIFFKDKQPVVICKKGLLKLITIRDEDNNNNPNLFFRTRFY